MKLLQESLVPDLAIEKDKERGLPTASLQQSILDWALSQKKLSILSEQRLILQINNTKKQSLRDQLMAQLVLANTSHCASMALKLRHYGVPVEDLIQQGIVGLYRSVNNFDVQRNFRFITFARTSILDEMFEIIYSSQRIGAIKKNTAHKKLFFNLNRYTPQNNRWFTACEKEHIALELGVGENDISEMEAVLNTTDITLTNEEEIFADLTSTQTGFIDTAQTTEAHRQLRAAVVQLPVRERDIIESRHLGEEVMPLRLLAKKYHVNASRIAQLEASALKKLKKILLRSERRTVDEFM